MGTERRWGRGVHSCWAFLRRQRQRAATPIGGTRRFRSRPAGWSNGPAPVVASMALPSNVHLHPPPVADAEDPHGSRHCSPQRPPVPRLETDAHALPITLKLLLRRCRGAVCTVCQYARALARHLVEAGLILAAAAAAAVVARMMAAMGHC